MADNEPDAWAFMVRWEYRDICDNEREARFRAESITYWDGGVQKTGVAVTVYRRP